MIQGFSTDPIPFLDFISWWLGVDVAMVYRIVFFVVVGKDEGRTQQRAWVVERRRLKLGSSGKRKMQLAFGAPAARERHNATAGGAVGTFRPARGRARGRKTGDSIYPGFGRFLGWRRAESVFWWIKGDYGSTARDPSAPSTPPAHSHHQVERLVFGLEEGRRVDRIMGSSEASEELRSMDDSTQGLGIILMDVSSNDRLNTKIMGEGSDLAAASETLVQTVCSWIKGQAHHAVKLHFWNGTKSISQQLDPAQFNPLSSRDWLRKRASRNLQGGCVTRTVDAE